MLLLGFKVEQVMLHNVYIAASPRTSKSTVACVWAMVNEWEAF